MNQKDNEAAKTDWLEAEINSKYISRMRELYDKVDKKEAEMSARWKEENRRLLEEKESLKKEYAEKFEKYQQVAMEREEKLKLELQSAERDVKILKDLKSELENEMAALRNRYEKEIEERIRKGVEFRIGKLNQELENHKKALEELGNLLNARDEEIIRLKAVEEERNNLREEIKIKEKKVYKIEIEMSGIKDEAEKEKEELQAGFSEKFSDQEKRHRHELEEIRKKHEAAEKELWQKNESKIKELQYFLTEKETLIKEKDESIIELGAELKQLQTAIGRKEKEVLQAKRECAALETGKEGLLVRIEDLRKSLSDKLEAERNLWNQEKAGLSAETERLTKNLQSSIAEIGDLRSRNLELEEQAIRKQALFSDEMVKIQKKHEEEIETRVFDKIRSYEKTIEELRKLLSDRERELDNIRETEREKQKIIEGLEKKAESGIEAEAAIVELQSQIVREREEFSKRLMERLAREEEKHKQTFEAERKRQETLRAENEREYELKINELKNILTGREALIKEKNGILNDMETELNRLKSEIAGKTKERAEAEGEKTALSARMEELRKESSSRMEAERNLWNQEKAGLSAETERLTKNLQSSIAEIGDLRSRNLELEEQSIRKEAFFNQQMIELKKKHEEEIKDKISKEVRQKTKEYNLELESSGKTIEELKSFLAKKDETLRRLEPVKEERDKLREELRELEKETREKDRMLSDKERMIESIRAELEAETRERRNQAAEAEKHRDELAERIRRESAGEIEAFLNREAELKEKIEKLNMENMLLKRGFKEKKPDAADAGRIAEKIRNLEDSLRARDREIEMLRKAPSAGASVEIQDTENFKSLILKEAEIQKRAWADEKEKMNSEIEAAVKAVETAKNEVHNLINRNSKLRELLHRKDRQIDELNVKKAELEAGFGRNKEESARTVKECLARQEKELRQINMDLQKKEEEKYRAKENELKKRFRARLERMEEERRANPDGIENPRSERSELKKKTEDDGI